MTRLAMTMSAAVVGICGIVALVRAQDGPATEPGLFPIAGPASTDTSAVQQAAATDSGETSVLIRSSTRSGSGSASLNDDRAPGSAVAPPSRPSAAERLKQIREAGNRTGSTSQGVMANRTVTGPVTTNPAELRQDQPPPGGGDSFSGRRATSLGAPVGTPATEPSADDRPTARRLLRSPGRSAPAELGSGAELNSPSNEANSPALPDRSPSFSDQSPSGVGAAPGNEMSSGPADGTLLTSRGPQLRVETTGPRSVVLGKEAKYTVTIYNDGDTAASNVFLRVGLPQSVRVMAEGGTPESADGDAEAGQLFAWSIPHIAGRNSETVTLNVVPTENRPVQLQVDWATRPASGFAQIEVLQPQLQIEVFGPRDVLFGDTAVYTIRIANPGTGDAEDVSVEFGYGEQHLGPKRIGNLAAGQQSELKVELNPREAGPIQVLASALAAGGLRVDAQQEVQVRRARLEVEVIGDQEAFAGSVAGYRVMVRNSGDAPVSDVVAAVGLPAGAKVSQSEGWKLASNGVQATIGTLPPGGERALLLQCLLSNAGENSFAVRVTGANDQEATGNCVTRVQALADLKLTINDPSGPVPLNQDTVYELHIVNRGTKAATKVNVVAQFSEGIEPVAITGAGGQIVPGQVVFESLPRIEVGQELTLIVKARASSDGTKRFRVEVTSDESETQLVAQETTYFYRAK